MNWEARAKLEIIRIFIILDVERRDEKLNNQWTSQDIFAALKYDNKLYTSSGLEIFISKITFTE